MEMLTGGIFFIRAILAHIKSASLIWQLWHVDVGVRDLAFLVALGGYLERMASIEQNLIRRYYDDLVAHGVRKYTWDDCWNDL